MVAGFEVRDTLIILFDSAFHFFKKAIMKLLGGFHHLSEVVIFLVEVVDDFRIFPVIHPIVVIDALMSVYF